MSDLRYSMISRYVRESAWAILPSKLAEIMAVLAVRAQGERISEAQIQAVMAASRDRAQPRANADMVAVVPIVGTIAHRADLFTESSGGTSVETIQKNFRAALADPDVSAIVFDIDSPGGSTSGIQELASEIAAARGQKPMTAVANTLMASAAYWLGSAADEVVATPSALVGSIGVIAAHQDASAFFEQEGLKYTLITAGKYKAENNPFEPLSDEGRAEIQKHVDAAYGDFTRAVAKQRGTSVDTVRSDYGQGRVFDAKEAVSIGMVDRVATIDAVIATIGRSNTKSTSGTEANAGLVLAPYEEHGQRVLADLSLFVDATRDRIAHRQTESRDGKLLSYAQRGRLLDISSELMALIEMTEPVQSATVPVEPLRARLQEVSFILAGVYG